MDFKCIKGVLFDVDGTLYNQSLLRLMMAVTFLIANLFHPKRLLNEARIIRAYRQAQEILRRSGSEKKKMGQIELVAQALNVPYTRVDTVVKKWMHEKPLVFLPLCRRRNLEKVIKELHRRGLRLGVYSDYPSREKLKVLQILRYMSVIGCSTDLDVRHMKPAPDGFLSVVQKMELSPSEVLYVGDRVDIDGLGAIQTGMQAAIIKSWPRRKVSSGAYYTIDSLGSLLSQL